MIPLLLQLLIAEIPQLPKLIVDFRELFKAHPALNPADLAAAIAQISVSTDAAADAILAKAAADATAAPKP